MTGASLLLIALAGLFGGAINAMVGSGTLLTYPLLLAAGIPPIAANGSNTTGLCLSGLAAAWGYRRFLDRRLRVVLPPLCLAIAGGALGATLVFMFPERVFTAIVPWLILGAVALIALQPLIRRALAAHPHRLRMVPLTASIGAGSVYGGYFGAGQGVIYMAILGEFYDPDVHRSNAFKNLIAGTANLSAALVFIVTGHLVWLAALVLMPTAIVGGLLGARLAMRLSPVLMRAVIMTVGVAAAIYILVTR